MLPISTANNNKAVFIIQSSLFGDCLDLDDDSRLDIYQLIRDFPVRARLRGAPPSASLIAPPDVRCWSKTGKHLLDLSLTAYDPKLTLPADNYRSAKGLLVPYVGCPRHCGIRSTEMMKQGSR
jgi:hypothetical protein